MGIEKDDAAAKIIALIKTAKVGGARAAPAKKATRRKKPIDPQPGVIYVAGNGNVVANGPVTSHVHHHVPARPRVVVKTGDGVISAEEKAVLRDLVGKWIEAFNTVKRSELTWAAAWASFNRAMKVNSYAELRPDQMPAARAWLQRQVALINAMPSAPRKAGDRWRTARYGSIKAKAKNQLGDEFAYVAYTLKHFGKTSLTELTDPELERTYRYIMGLKPAL